MTICAEAALKIRRLEAEVARLHQALDDYGGHKSWCISHEPRHDKSCNCGFNAARQRTPDTATNGKAE